MPSLLVVDDEMDIRELLRAAFTREGCEVVTVPRVAQALDALAKRPFDLVVLDLHFPDEAAAPLVRHMRASKNWTPVIVYTGSVSPKEDAELREAGVSDVLLKNKGLSPLIDAAKCLFAAGGKASGVRSAAARTALVVDDEAAIRKVLRRFLESRHFTVVEAESGTAAAEVVRNSGFTVVFLDVNMPGGDGIGALQEIRNIRPEQPVIMVTGEQDDRTVGRAVELGAAGYVVKPFDFLYLEMMLVSKLDSKRSGA